MVKTKERRHTKDIHRQFAVSFLIIPTGNSIREGGATLLSEALKTNKTLTELNLTCEDKKRHLIGVNQQITFFSFLFSSTDNWIGVRGATTFSESLKTNTTLTKLYLGGEDKRRHKRHPSTIHSFPSSSQHRQLD